MSSRRFVEIHVTADRKADVVRVYTPDQEIVFTHGELSAVIPHQRDHYIESRMRVFRRLIEPRITPVSYRRPEKPFPFAGMSPVGPETRKDVEADIMKMYYESRQRSRGPRSSFGDEFKQPQDRYRQWKAEYEGDWE